MLSTVEQQGAGYINSRERTYEGWAVVDVLGHQRHAGYVTTEYFGQTAFFRVVTPARESCARVIEREEWFQGFGSCPKGSRVAYSAKPGAERLIGAGSIYQLTPTAQEQVLAILEDIDPRDVIGATDPDGKAIEKPKPSDDGMPW